MKKLSLMTHVVIGYPDLESTYRIVEQMVEEGVAYIELQIPFSDPLADGPVIMAANDRALKNGVTLKDCFKFMERVSHDFPINFLFMGYFNSVFHFGVEDFCQRAQQVGAYGLIIPDIPIDEEPAENFIKSCETHNLHHIRLLSPTSTLERIQLNARYQNGFVYCTSRVGTTGAGVQVDPQLEQFLQLVRQYFTVPVAVGFGISQPEHVRALRGIADIAVIGSAVIEQITKNGVESVQPFIRQLIEATQN